MSRITLAAAAALSLTLQPGCLTLYSKTEVVRGDETRRAVQFDCSQTAECFHAAMKKHGGHLGGTYFGVPFVTFISKSKELSPSAQWNDAVARCDTNQDGFITRDEVTIFAGPEAGH